MPQRPSIEPERGASLLQYAEISFGNQDLYLIKNKTFVSFLILITPRPKLKKVQSELLFGKEVYRIVVLHSKREGGCRISKTFSFSLVVVVVRVTPLFHQTISFEKGKNGKKELCFSSHFCHHITLSFAHLFA